MAKIPQKEKEKITDMENLLNKVTSSNEIKNLSVAEVKALCGEIREFLIDKVSKTGGHLASNLGVVELTVALHRSLDLSKDNIIWDVGHQSYVHKMLTGRKDMFDSLRMEDGLSGFPKTSENETDSFNTGHSSTSISAALGIATANKLSGNDGTVVAVIGDGAMTGGMAYEALNHAGSLQIPMIIILNDNGIAISPSVGGLSRQFNKIRISPSYLRFKSQLKYYVRQIPGIGEPVQKIFSDTKKALKRVFVKDGIFESLGITYMGPANGHDVEEMSRLIDEAKKRKELTVIHIKTIKGKGYEPAEKHPEVFHGVGTFDPETGEVVSSTSVSYSDVFGKSLIKVADENEKVVGITAAMPNGTGMTDFSRKYPHRFFDVGIAEQHAVTFSAGLAQKGVIPVFAVYSTFLQRGYDQLLHDVALQNLHCVFALDRAGIVGRDGETHQGIYDFSYLSHLPGFTVMAPSSGEELENMISFAVNSCEGPVAVRYPRGEAKSIPTEDIEMGRGRVLKDGNDAVIIAIGSAVSDALEAAEILENSGISTAVLDMRFLKPIDKELVLKYALKCKICVTAEENIKTGGLCSIVKEFVNCDVFSFALPDEPVHQGSQGQIKKRYGIDPEAMANVIAEKYNEK